MIPLLQRNTNGYVPANRDPDDEDISVNNNNAPFQEPEIANNTLNNLQNIRAFSFTLEQEQVRRQQILRMGLIICALFFFMDQTNYNSNNPPDHHNYVTNKTCGNPLDEICLSGNDLQSAKNVLLPYRTNPSSSDGIVKHNVTGFYKGDWLSYTSGGNLSSSISGSGSLIFQTKTLPFHNLPDLSFTYGVMRVYDHNLELVPELSSTMQGVLLTAQRKLLMFATPYKSQKLMFQFLDKTSISTSSNSYKTMTIPSHYNNHANVLFQLAGGGPNPSSNLNTQNIGIKTQNYQALNLFIYDSTLGPQNSSSWENNYTHTFTPAEGSLSPRFKFLQKTRVLSTAKTPHLRVTNSISGNNGSVSSEPVMFVFDLEISEKTVKIRRLATDTDLQNNIFEAQAAADVKPKAEKEKEKMGEERVLLASDSSVTAALVPSAESVSGSMTCYFNCQSTPSLPSSSIYFSVSSYEHQLDKLQTKVEIYSLIYTAICLAQILLTITQIRYAATQSANSKISIFTLLSQSVLDAVLCMFHLALATSLANIFFASFLWISVLKLLLFSVFQMRIIINSYQARYAQEIANEGWRGLRSRLVALHLRFYFVVLFVLVMGMSFPFSPWIIVLTMYSFWWPQIIHSVYQGTRHPFHPLYLFGTSLTRLFLPLYIIGCPENFFVSLIKYYSASGELPPNSGFLSLSACYFLVIWQCLQVGIMCLQSIFGARFFVPKRFLPGRYDYHRPLPPSIAPPAASTAVANSSRRSSSGSRGDVDDSYGDIETGSLLPSCNIANSSSSVAVGGEDEGEEGGLECVICYNAIHLHLQHQYMITPCDHVFHEECLVRWLAVKLECPVCRAALPPHDDGETQDDD